MSSTIKTQPIVGLAASIALAVALGGCISDGGESARGPGLEQAGPPALFTEITARVGLESPAAPWPDGTYDLPEMMQGGIALFDYDDDGDLDLLHVRVPPPGRPQDPAPNRLYQQQPDGTFRDVTAESGLGDPGYGQGVAVGDVDNDGDLDVYVTNFGADALYRNNGDGTFVDATSSAGFEGERWSVAAAFCDYDRDADLDLYVVHYLRFDPDTVCLDKDSRQEFCGPSAFPGEPDKLYRNDGDGIFTDVTQKAGIVLPRGGERARGLGVVCAPLTGDDLADFFVANDGEANQLWTNRGDGTFVEDGIIRGVAVSTLGKSEASMGVTVGDANGDGVFDLFMTHLTLENNRLYLGSGGEMFFDRSWDSQLARYDEPFTGFGCGFVDFDNDGDLDLAVANGKTRRGPVAEGAELGRFWNEYGEPNQLFENDGNAVFSDAGPRAGSFTSAVEVSRGLAFGDLDGDGDTDLVLSNVDNSLRVFRNDAPPPDSHWLLVSALTREGRDALGARVTARVREKTLHRLVLAAYSYGSSNDPRAHFGLGDQERLDEIEVAWPDGQRERFPVGAVDRELTLRQGEGAAP